MMSALETTTFKNIYAYTDQTAFFDTFRTLPIISTAPSLVEAALNTALAIAALSAVIALQTARILPLPEEQKKEISKLRSDSLNLLKIFLSRVAHAVTSAIPFAGNYMVQQLTEQKEINTRLQISLAAFESSSSREASKVAEVEEQEQLTTGAELLQQASGEIEALQSENKELRAELDQYYRK
jgi:hypothetical protein